VKIGIYSFFRTKIRVSGSNMNIIDVLILYIKSVNTKKRNILDLAPYFINKIPRHFLFDLLHVILIFDCISQGIHIYVQHPLSKPGMYIIYSECSRHTSRILYIYL
jgi:hypothetical protein